MMTKSWWLLLFSTTRNVEESRCVVTRYCDCVSRQVLVGWYKLIFPQRRKPAGRANKMQEFGGKPLLRASRATGARRISSQPRRLLLQVGTGKIWNPEGNLKKRKKKPLAWKTMGFGSGGKNSGCGAWSGLGLQTSEEQGTGLTQRVIICIINVAEGKTAAIGSLMSYAAVVPEEHLLETASVVSKMCAGAAQRSPPALASCSKTTNGRSQTHRR